MVLGKTTIMKKAVCLLNIFLLGSLFLCAQPEKVCYIWVTNHWERPKAGVTYPPDSLHCFDLGNVPPSPQGGVAVTNRPTDHRNEPATVTNQPPLDIKFINDYPGNRNFSWSENTQGIANDDANWYVSQSGRLWKIPFTTDINSSISPTSANIKTVVIPQSLKDMGFNHFGDLDCFDGKLFVPIEGTQPCKIAVFRASDLSFLAAADMIIPGSDKALKQTNASWCAIDPVTKILWTSNFNNVKEIFGYSYTLQDTKAGFQLKLNYANSKTLKHTVEKVQGGAFSIRSGLFYLVSDVSKII